MSLTGRFNIYGERLDRGARGRQRQSEPHRPRRSQPDAVSSGLVMCRLRRARRGEAPSPASADAGLFICAAAQMRAARDTRSRISEPLPRTNAQLPRRPALRISDAGHAKRRFCIVRGTCRELRADTLRLDAPRIRAKLPGYPRTKTAGGTKFPFCAVGVDLTPALTPAS